MGAVWVILGVAAAFLAAGILIFCGKGGWLIGGYNTASAEERKTMDPKRIFRAAGSICMVCAGMLGVMAAFGYCVETGRLSERVMLPFGLVFAAVILIMLGLASVYLHGGHKK